MYWRDLGYLLSLIPVSLTLLGNILGGDWTLGNILFTLVGLVLTDWFIGERKDQPEPHSPLIANVLLVIHVLTHTAAIASLAVGAATGKLSGKFLLFATVSTGVNSGVSGIVVAHELIHRKERLWQALGIWNLLLVNYAHFFIEHIKAHHKYAATPKDAATAQYGETVYGFIRRTIPAQFQSALSLEAERLRKKGKAPFGLENFVVRNTLVQALITASVFLGLGPAAGLAYLGQAAIAVCLLEITNYAQHYGLRRSENERISAAHSWNTDHLSSRFFLLELPRHSDHHYYAARPYQELRSYPESPTLPTGYLGLLPVVLIPPLWFKLIHPILAEHHKVQKVQPVLS
ncbi:MAG: alkane 1-monooxygenase [Chloroherpetonaceae bacterium]|nr:alkane 1-monooxygenase [Chloroherpetonaceae bacterium]MCS7211505.1 alkane 1-monooxygenase [Chloroherpetonaceae bacterium]MDW8020130.1 alkane 1-monooxygenase [Chloroherpetonaceae bacterium]MDW8467477.1 alkane 1-monooxygenase [Chloroherpetonaceae bacterium]